MGLKAKVWEMISRGAKRDGTLLARLYAEIAPPSGHSRLEVGALEQGRFLFAFEAGWLRWRDILLLPQCVIVFLDQSRQNAVPAKTDMYDTMCRVRSLALQSYEISPGELDCCRSDAEVMGMYEDLDAGHPLRTSSVWCW